MNKKGVAQGQKAAIAPEHVAAIKLHLDIRGSTRDRCLFAVAVDSMLRGCDLVRLRVGDVMDGNGNIRESFSVVQGKVPAGKLSPSSVTSRLPREPRSLPTCSASIAPSRSSPAKADKGR